MKRRTVSVAWVLTLVLAIVLQGCKKDNSQELIDQEMRLLQQYLTDNNITQEPTASGLYYIEIEEGTGTQPNNEFIVDFNYTTKLIDGTTIGTSYETVAQSNDFYSEGIIYGPLRMIVGYTSVPGLDEGLKLMKEGGKAKMIIPSSINGVGGSPRGPSPAYATHIYEVELIHAFDDPEQFQTNQIILYIQENGIDSVYVTDSGLHYIEQKPGMGDNIKNGDIVDLWYTGRYLDGRVFDSNLDDQVMTVDMPADGYIPAWDEALKLMKEGSEAMFIVPYNLAYGPYGTNTIPFYSTLVFDLKIEKVSPL